MKQPIEISAGQLPDLGMLPVIDQMQRVDPTTHIEAPASILRDKNILDMMYSDKLNGRMVATNT